MIDDCLAQYVAKLKTKTEMVGEEYVEDSNFFMITKIHFILRSSIISSKIEHALDVPCSRKFQDTKQSLEV